ncbi:MAG: hypothetical protein IJL53_02030 [Firmicutes bacterium]|nr:hypothetical protein [Bacillota bacterium]
MTNWKAIAGRIAAVVLVIAMIAAVLLPGKNPGQEAPVTASVVKGGSMQKATQDVSITAYAAALDKTPAVVSFIAVDAEVSEIVIPEATRYLAADETSAAVQVIPAVQLHKEEAEVKAQAEAEAAAQRAAEQKAAEEAKKAAEQKAAEEAARKAAEQKAAEEAAKKAEEQKAAEEAAKKAEEQKAAEEAAKKAEEQKAAEEAAKKAEEQKAAEEAAKKAEESKKEESSKAEESKKEESSKTEESKKEESSKAEESKKEESSKIEESKAEESKAEESKAEESSVAEEPAEPEPEPEPEPQDPVDDSPLNAYMGVNYYNGHKETYYNMYMGGLIDAMNRGGWAYNDCINKDIIDNILDTSGYWIRSDGCKMFGGYIILAASEYEYSRGSIVSTSLGTGIVLDRGVGPGVIDIAVNW